MMNSKITNSELVSIAQNDEEFNYVSKLLECNKYHNANKNIWIMGLDCKVSLIKYSRWIVNYPEHYSSLCLGQKLAVNKWYQRPVTTINISLAKDHFDFTF